MAIYSLGVATTINTANAPALEIRSSSSLAPRVMEFTLTAGGVSSTWAFGRATTRGNPSAPVNLQPENASDPVSQTVVATAWVVSGPNTFSAAFNTLRRVTFPGNAGEGVIWTFPYGLLMPVDTSLVLWNAPGGSATNCTIVVDE